jgi:hypothetical protein
VERTDPDPLIPSVSEVRARLTRAIQDAKLLRQQLRVSEDAAAETYRRRSPSGQISRYDRQENPSRGQ